MIRRRLLGSILAPCVLVLSLAGQAFAGEPLTLAEQAEARGGILVAGGLSFEFGAVVRTFEDGMLALQTQVTWSPEGIVTRQEIGEGAVGHVAPAGAAAPGGGYYSQNGAIFAHNVSGGQLLNVLLNTDSGRTYLQQTDITIKLPGFEGVQGGMQQGLLGLRLNDDIALGSVGALR